ncbi:MAG: efflux RND transporter permease subunit [Pseudomonadota bacterium]
MTGALETVLTRPKTVLTMMVVMVLAGIITYINIPKEANPDIDVPVYYVSITQQGVSPKDAERLLVKPMETELRGLEGLKEITSIAAQSHAGITLEFTIGSDKDKVLADIRDKVDLAKAELPEDAEEPAIFATNLALQPTIIISLSGRVPERTLYRYAKQLQDEIEAIASVREASLKGIREEQIEVLLDLVKLESYDITQTELLNAVSAYNQLVPAGFIDNGNARFNLEVPGLIETVEHVYSIPIKQNGEGVVTLGEVADIRRNFKDASSYTRVNGENAMSLEVVKRIGTNIIENNIEVRKITDAFTEEWPDTIEVTYLIDQSNFIFEVLGSLQSAILTAIALVMIIVVASLGVSSGLLVGIAIPTSFMIGFLILSAVGLTVNMMVMFGMVLTVGMLVDGAIVVTEYADRKIAEGMPPNKAYPRAAKLMFWPVISSTATTLAAFLPLLLWPGVPGEFMSYLPIMVIIVLSASLITALVFLPTMGMAVASVGKFLKRYSRAFKSLFVAIGFGFVGAFLFAPVLINAGISSPPSTLSFWCGVLFALVGGLCAWYLFGKFSRTKQEDKPEVMKATSLTSSDQKLDLAEIRGVLGGYLRFLNLVTRGVFGNLAVVVAAICITVGTFMMFGQLNKGVEFFVDEEPDIALLFVSARGNLSGSDIRDIAIKVEERVLKIDGIDNLIMTATAPGGGGGGGVNPSLPQDMPADMLVFGMIELEDYSQRRKAVEIFSEIREEVASLAGIKVELRKLEGGPPTGKDIRLEVKSTNYDDMVTAVAKIRGMFDGLSNMQDIEDERALPGIDWELTVDREEAGRYNASIPAVGAMIQLITNGALIGTSNPNDSDEQIDIRVRLPEEERSLDRLGEFRLRTENGLVPIANFIDVRPKSKISSLKRRDGLYAMDIKANLLASAKADGLTPDEKIQEIQTWLDEQDWPQNIYLKFRGADEEQKESGEFLTKAAGGALFLMFIILVTQFNSFYQTILTLMTVILAIVGVLIGMMITGQKFSIIMTGTGVVALAGIVVNNAIVLIDTYNRLRSEGASVHDAVLKTSGQRLRPILLTTITTIMGLIPMALTVNLDFISQTISVGSITAIWWVQLSTAIISGLAFSTLLTLILIPVMLTLPTNIVSLPAKVRNLYANRKGQSQLVAAGEADLVDAVAEDAVAVPQVADKVAENAEETVTPPSFKVPKKRKVPVKRKPKAKSQAPKKHGSKSVAVDAAE